MQGASGVRLRRKEALIYFSIHGRPHCNLMCRGLKLRHGVKSKKKSSKEDENQRFIPVEDAGGDKLQAGGGFWRTCKQIPVE